MDTRRPYLLRAMYDWIVDQGWTPFLLVDASQPGVEVPDSYVQDGRIVLNVSPAACAALSLGNDEVSFQARFGGQPYTIRFSPHAVLAVYARENGEGLVFASDDGPAPEPSPSPPKPGKPKLSVVK